MSIKAQTPDGVIHEFPDGTPQSVVDAAMKSYVQTTPVMENAPKTGMAGTATDILKGLYLGTRQPLDVAAMRIEQAFPSLSKLGANIGLEPSASAILTERNRQAAANPAKISQLVGNIAGVAPALAAVGIPAAPATFTQAALGGGVTSGLLSEAATPGGVAADIGTGAVLGIPGKLVGDVVGGVIAPKVSEGIRTLSDLGVRLTPGAILGSSKGFVGNIANTFETALTSIPGVGALISNARSYVPEDFEKATVNRLANFIGEKLPNNLSGDQAVSWVKKNISSKFEKLAPNLDMTLPSVWKTEIGNIFGGLDLPPSKQSLTDDFFSTVKKNVEDVTDANGRINGKNLQNALSSLSNNARTFMKSTDGFERRVGAGLAQVRSWMLETLANQNPGQADELLKLNKAWNAQSVLDKAVGYVGNVVSPSSLTRAVKSLNGGKISGVFEDLTRAGMELPKGLAESGTFTRAAIAQGLGLAGAGAGAGYLAQQDSGMPYAETAIPTLAALAAAYSPAGRRALQAIMTREAGPVSQAISQAAKTVLSPSGFAAAGAEPTVKMASLGPDTNALLQQFRKNAPKGQVLIDIFQNEDGSVAPQYGYKKYYGKGI